MLFRVFTENPLKQHSGLAATTSTADANQTVTPIDFS